MGGNGSGGEASRRERHVRGKQEQDEDRGDGVGDQSDQLRDVWPVDRKSVRNLDRRIQVFEASVDKCAAQETSLIFRAVPNPSPWPYCAPVPD